MNKDKNYSSVVQCHFGSLPNDRDGISGIALRDPAMCMGVSGDTPTCFIRSASARSNWPAMSDPRAAIRRTQQTVGELSLNKPTCDSRRWGHTSSITSHRMSKPAISKSELVMLPFGLRTETKSAEMSGSYWSRNTVGVQALASPMMTPPTPCFDASLTPM